MKPRVIGAGPQGRIRFLELCLYQRIKRLVSTAQDNHWPDWCMYLATAGMNCRQWSRAQPSAASDAPSRRTTSHTENYFASTAAANNAIYDSVIERKHLPLWHTTHSPVHLSRAVSSAYSQSATCQKRDGRANHVWTFSSAYAAWSALETVLDFPLHVVWSTPRNCLIWEESFIVASLETWQIRRLPSGNNWFPNGSRSRLSTAAEVRYRILPNILGACRHGGCEATLPNQKVVM